MICKNSKMFHRFVNCGDIRKFDGSAFIEFQYCKLKQGIEIGKNFYKDYNHWQDDS